MHKRYDANWPPVSATDAVKPYREPSIVLMSMHDPKLLWASKFATAKFKCSFEIGK